jgi:hypothetical protein
MAEHLQFTVDSGVQVYFCDPRSPWQRGPNENTDGLLASTCPGAPEVVPGFVDLEVAVPHLSPAIW